MTYTAWMVEWTGDNTITLRNHIPKNYVFSWGGACAPYITCMAMPLGICTCLLHTVVGYWITWLYTSTFVIVNSIESQRGLVFLFFCAIIARNLPSGLWHCWLAVRKNIRPVKVEWWGVLGNWFWLTHPFNGLFSWTTWVSQYQWVMEY